MQKLFESKGYNLLSTKYENNKKPLLFEKDGYMYYNTYNSFIKTDNPKKWSVNNPYSIENLKLYLKRDGATCTVLSDSYDYKSVKLRCECGREYCVSWSNLIGSKQYCCPFCGHQRGGDKHRIDEKFLPFLGKYQLTLCEQYSGSKVYHWAKTKEGYMTRVQLYSLSKGIDPYDFVFDLDNEYALDNIKQWLKINGQGLIILSNKYIGAKQRYKFKCACGEEFETSWQYIYLNKITRCPRCSHKMSGLELKTKEWLDENNLSYEKEKTFPDCVYEKPLRFDFYLPDLNKIIEVDGQQHFKPSNFGSVSWDKAEENFKSTKERDLIKDEYCEKHGIELLRIPYTAFNSEKYKTMLLTFTAKT